MGYVVKQEKAVIAVAEASRAAANDSGIATAKPPAGRRRSLAWTPARAGVYAFLIVAALFFLLPLYVML